MSGTSEENRECGIRHTFTVKVRDRLPNHYPEEAARLAHWCNVFDAEGLAPVVGGASAGNLSFRTPRGFMITATRSTLKSGLGWRDFVEVVREDLLGWEIHVLGERPPSSDAFLHGRIYAARPDVAAVLHGHDDVVLERADDLARLHGARVTAQARRFGTRIDAEETAEALGDGSFVIRRGHGFAAVGKSVDEAGALAVFMHREAVRLARG